MDCLKEINRRMPAATPLSAKVRLPIWLIWATIALCGLPVLLNLMGFDFTFKGGIRDADDIPNLNLDHQLIYHYMAGVLIHTILEWSSFCFALFIVVFAFTNYSITRDVTTPIIGTALFLSGMLDGFKLLFADSLIEIETLYGVTDFSEKLQDTARRDFVFFTSAFARSYGAGVLIAAVAPFLDPKRDQRTSFGQGSLRYFALVGMLLALISLAIVAFFATVPGLPQTVLRGQFISRPWDLMPLGLYLFAGLIVFPRFYKVQPSLFSHALIISAIPNVVSSVYAAFGSENMYDNNFNVALYLKNIAYLVPLAGLLLDYVRAYQTELELRATQEKLQVAHRVQQGLLPDHAPSMPGFDLAGASYPAEAVGGDYFDFIPMRDHRLGIVVADVSGHEVGASILMAQTRAYLRALALTDQDLSSILSNVNRFLVKDVQNRWFVTLFLLRLEPRTGEFNYGAAGHECYLLNAAGDVKTLESTSPPLGVLDDDALACSPPQTIDCGDLLLLITDGILETPAANGDRYGLQRVIDTIEAHRGGSADQIVGELYRSVTEFRGRRPQEDDITIVVVKRNPTNGHQS